MNSLVIYDSNCGNTQKIAETIAREMGAKALNISTIKPNEIAGVDLLVVGTPIIGWKPTVKMQQFLGDIKPGQLKDMKATTFDTRVKLFIHGDAMKQVAKSLAAKGADIYTEPMAFYVAGPQDEPNLLDGEIEKAKAWAKTLITK